MHLIVQLPPELTISGYIGAWKARVRFECWEGFETCASISTGAITFGRKAAVLARWGWSERWYASM